MNNDRIETRDEELAQAESNDEQLTVEVPSEIRAGARHNSTEYPACGNVLA